MNILLTGISGFIGRSLSKRLIADGHALYAIVRETTDIKNIDKNISLFVFNDSCKDLYEFITNNRINGLIHLATHFVAEHHYEDIDGLVESIIKFPIKVIEAAIKSDIQWFLNTGTVWQNHNGSDVYLPTNLYSATKQAFDDILDYYREISICKFTTLKICDTYGVNDTRRKILNLLKEHSTANDKLLKMSPGEQLIDILHIDDVVNGYIKLIEFISQTEKPLIEKQYLISSLDLIKLNKLVSSYEEITHTKLNIAWGGRPYREREVMTPWISGNIVPNWQREITLQDGIKRFLQISDNENE